LAPCTWIDPAHTRRSEGYDEFETWGAYNTSAERSEHSRNAGREADKICVAFPYLSISGTVQTPLTFLLVELNPEGADLLSRTLSRKFPGAIILSKQHVEDAIQVAAMHALDAIVVHRSIETSGEHLVRLLRSAQPNAPIVMISSVDRASEAKAAGADGFLLYDAWLMLGGVIADLLKRGSRQPWGDLDAVNQAAATPSVHTSSTSPG
jgi:CheY-like chemotaxis protein